MYLTKDRYCTYYTRIPLPKELRDAGYPFSVRVSLNTKKRSIATKRNLATALHITQLLEDIPPEIRVNTFKCWFQDSMSVFKKEGFKSCLAQQNQAMEVTKSNDTSKLFKTSKAFEEFIESKQADKISFRSINQLKLRINHFIDWSKNPALGFTSTKDAMQYRDFLLMQGRSYKTNHSYLSAINQFFNWCTIVEYIEKNPFKNVRLGQKPTKKKYEERVRWNSVQLSTLFEYLDPRYFSKKHTIYKQANYWVPLLGLYGGLRTAEACQLKVDSLQTVQDVLVLNIENADKDSRLKTNSSYRTVPLHSYLIELGFLNYIERRKALGYQLLFDEKPTGNYGDWSKKITARFTRIMNQLGFEAGNRPTIYGLRHTFIDELQQQEVNENIVAELVGHTKNNITFGRYGKKLNLAVLKKNIELVPKSLINLKKIEK